ncbi:DUF742 domain-containing protein [Actinocorallia longicatena]|uniref:DUF742 domain-containing protein n=1 Tax=Actinocorallia longicatena TaxID=111803 RepID=A0ABP6QNZ1_9ACTN
MIRREVDREDPDRLYTVTKGRADTSSIGLDVVTLVIAEREPARGMQSEHAEILRLAREPISVVELSAELHLPVSVIKILLGDLLDTGGVTVRRRTLPPLPDMEILKQVLIGLENL